MSSDVIVIGGGIAGLATAHELLRLGATVTILERNRCGREASWAGAGILSPLLPWDYPESVTQLTQLSNRLFPQFVEALQEETGIDPEYQVSGMLVLPRSASSPCLPLSESQTPENDSHTHLPERWCAHHSVQMRPVRAHDIVPILARDAAALWLPEICQVRNPRLLQALVKAIGRAGGNIVEHAEVTSWKIERGHVQAISTSRGEHYSAASYVVAAGAWSPQLLGKYALKLDLWPVRGEMLLFKTSPGLLNTIVLEEPDNFYLIPRRDGHILAGSTLEEAGFDNQATAQGRKVLLEKARALLPSLNEETLAGHWAGLRPGSPRNIPVIDRHPQISNLYLNAGHYRYGVTMAPGSAQLVSNMMLGRPQPLDLIPYRWPA
ncbi:MAG TPA: glycine oxidase ThiO [Nitrosospira sp.]|nr:glycine oxidase ThiO [Nitrosospira sp.]